MRVRDCTLIAVVIIVILLAGEAISYVSNPFSTSSELHSDGDAYTLYMDSNYSTEYAVIVTETEANSSDRHLYIYRDPDYASFIEDSYLDYWIEKMVAEFEVYNFSDYTILNAEGLRDMMAGSIYNGVADETAVIMLTGALPDTVYGEEDSIYEMWLAAGGFVYWSGQSMGMYVAHEESIDPVPELVEEDPGMRFFGISGSIGTDSSPVLGTDPSDDRYIGEALNIFYDSCNYGVRGDVPDSLFIGCQKGGYNSIALSKFAGGTGQICIFGGKFPPNDMQTVHSNMLKVFFSGICYDSDVVLIENGTKDPGRTGVTFSISEGSDAVVFFMYGSLLGTYGNTFRIPSGEGADTW